MLCNLGNYRPIVFCNVFVANQTKTSVNETDAQNKQNTIEIEKKSNITTYDML